MLDVLDRGGRVSILIAAIDAADLNETLADEGPFTIFAPTDEAFESAFEEFEITPEQLLADTDRLTQILTYHLLPEVADATALTTLDGEPVPTVNGEPVAISIAADDEIKVNTATMLWSNLEADNGLVHALDRVLLPPTVAGGAGPSHDDEHDDEHDCRRDIDLDHRGPAGLGVSDNHRRDPPLLPANPVGAAPVGPTFRSCRLGSAFSRRPVGGLGGGDLLPETGTGRCSLWARPPMGARSPRQGRSSVSVGGEQP